MSIRRNRVEDTLWSNRSVLRHSFSTTTLSLLRKLKNSSDVLIQIPKTSLELSATIVAARTSPKFFELTAINSNRLARKNWLAVLSAELANWEVHQFARLERDWKISTLPRLTKLRPFRPGPRHKLHRKRSLRIYIAVAGGEARPAHAPTLPGVWLSDFAWCVNCLAIYSP